MHVVTGDLDIESNSKLRTILSQLSKVPWGTVIKKYTLLQLWIMCSKSSKGGDVEFERLSKCVKAVSSLINPECLNWKKSKKTNQLLIFLNLSDSSCRCTYFAGNIAYILVSCDLLTTLFGERLSPWHIFCWPTETWK